MKLVNRILIFSLLGLILILNIGIDVYRVHCDMRDKTYISLLTGQDPCLIEAPVESTTCCKSKTHCSAQDTEKEDDSCCDEEQFTITFEPDYFQKAEFKTFINFWIASPAQVFSLPTIDGYAVLSTYANFPQPPPLSGRDILTLHAVLRI